MRTHKWILSIVSCFIASSLSTTGAVAATEGVTMSGRVLSVSTTAALDTRPNVVVIMTDDQRADEMRFMPRTRRLIGAQGTTFTQAYTPLALCCPTRAMFVTGQHAHNHHVMGNTPAQGGGYGVFKHRSKPRDTLGPWLKATGYHTGFAGKFMNRYGDMNQREIPPGWDDWRATPGMQSFDFTNQLWNVNGTLRRIKGHNTRVVTDQAIQTMKSGNQPFFTWVSYVAPHQQWKPGNRWTPPTALKADRNAKVRLGAPRLERDRSDKPTWYRRQPMNLPELNRLRMGRARALISVDRQVARIVRYLKKTERLENTILVFTSDNGFSLGEHGVQYGKTYPHEDVTRVPLLMRGPGVPTGVVKSMVETADITAMLVDVAGARPQRTLDGVSLLDVAQSPSQYSTRPMLYESGPVLGYPIIAHVQRGRQFYTAIHAGDWVYIRYHDGQDELYNLARDPGQKSSLDANKRFAPIKRQLAARLSTLRNCAGKECNTSFQLK